jgi:hypothetical protein
MICRASVSDANPIASAFATNALQVPNCSPADGCPRPATFCRIDRSHLWMFLSALRVATFHAEKQSEIPRLRSE